MLLMDYSVVSYDGECVELVHICQYLGHVLSQIPLTQIAKMDKSCQNWLVYHKKSTATKLCAFFSQIPQQNHVTAVTALPTLTDVMLM